MLIEDYSLNEAFYITVITVTSVGFGVVREFSAVRRIFTTFLIIISFGTFAYAISAITTYVLSGDFKNYYQDYRVNKEIEQIKNHVVICGFGRNGQASHREFAINND